ncbi:MAG: SAM-dependent methyltransferase [Sphingomonas sp.]|nr:SAM-dependent methyltransferase [Sphingomonas sp.]
MAAANAHYYATRDPLGRDFTTAPEISQMFGELIGLWLADIWDRAGRPAAAYVELGPGRGTLAADALRAMAKAGLVPAVHFVETSPTLRSAQAERLPGAIWHDDTTTLPGDIALLLVANEFFDALPIRQLVRGADGWHERLVACQDTLFLPIAGRQVPEAILPPTLRDAAPGSVIETSPASVAVMRDLAGRIARQGGAMLTIDYGYQGPAIGDTLQAMRAGAYANPFEAPGAHDLTAHVDFATLCAAAEAEEATSFGPVDQGALLIALGIDARAAVLGDSVRADRDRLVASDQMGRLFKAIAITAANWPQPAGFA